MHHRQQKQITDEAKSKNDNRTKNLSRAQDTDKTVNRKPHEKATRGCCHCWDEHEMSRGNSRREA